MQLFFYLSVGPPSVLTHRHSFWFYCCVLKARFIPCAHSFRGTKIHVSYLDHIFSPNLTRFLGEMNAFLGLFLRLLLATECSLGLLYFSPSSGRLNDLKVDLLYFGLLWVSWEVFWCNLRSFLRFKEFVPELIRPFSLSFSQNLSKSPVKFFERSSAK